MELADAKYGFPKMRHYGGFLHMGSLYLSKVVLTFSAIKLIAKILGSLSF